MLMRSCGLLEALPPRVCTFTRALLLAAVALVPESVHVAGSRLWRNYGSKGAGGEILVMGCRRGAGLGGGGTRCWWKTSVKATCGAHVGLSTLQVCFLWQLRI